MSVTLSLFVYNPTSGPSVKEFRMAARNKPLNGSTIGLIDNGKMNSDTIIKTIANRLSLKYQFIDILIHKKASFSHGIVEQDAIILANKCDFIISGVGD
jgi:hypothetical protein